jgi:hypothetical protein
MVCWCVNTLTQDVMLAFFQLRIRPAQQHVAGAQDGAQDDQQNDERLHNSVSP